MRSSLPIRKCSVARGLLAPAGENAKVIGLLAPLDQPNQGDLAIAYLLGMACCAISRSIAGN